MITFSNKYFVSTLTVSFRAKGMIIINSHRVPVPKKNKKELIPCHSEY